MVQAGISAPRLTSVEDAKRMVLEQAEPLGTELVVLPASVGRVVARDLIAETDLPPFDNSSMDGYAVRSSDVAGASTEQPVVLRLTGEVAAGEVLGRAVSLGEAVRIMTGAPLPPGADSVVALVEARLRGERVEILEEVLPGRHVRNAGEDIQASAVALVAGTWMQLQHLGLLAGLGYARVPVYRLPRVAVLTTGSELVGADEPLAPGKIRNSNSLVLVALLRQLGIEPVDLGVAVDERDLIRQRLEEASQYDVILVSGGVSVGEHDLVKRVLRDLGMETLLWRVNLKPGKPLLVGRLPACLRQAGWLAGWRGTVVFGLPGNPISCVVCFLEFISPFLRKTMGEEMADDGRIHARLTQPLRKKEPRLQLFTAKLEEEQGMRWVTPTPQQGSGMLHSLAHANAFIVVPEDTMQLDAGSVVDVLPFGGDPWPW